jgi:hypothetical protein
VTHYLAVYDHEENAWIQRHDTFDDAATALVKFCREQLRNLSDDDYYDSDLNDRNAVEIYFDSYGNHYMITENVFEGELNDAARRGSDGSIQMT